MTRHEPAVTPSGTSEHDESRAQDGRFDSAKPFDPTWKGFSSAGLVRSAVGVAAMSVMVWLILAVLDQQGLGLLLMLPVLAGAAVLYVLSMRRRGRDRVTEALSDALARELELPDASYLEVDARQWRGGWVGVPHLLNVRYPPAVGDQGEEWPTRMADAVYAELGEQYIVARHNVRARRLTLRDPKRSPGRLSHQTESTQVSPPPKSRMPEKVDRPIPTESDLASGLIPIGVDASGTKLAWKPNGAQGHLLALGRSGAGKRVLLTGLVVEMASRGWPVWIIDHRRVDLLGVRDWPNVQIVASTLDDQIVVLNQAWREMESRVALIESGASPAELEPLVLVVHHFREFATAVSEAAARADQGAAGTSLVVDRVTDLLRHGRQVNIVVVLSIQRADDPLLRDDYRDDLGAIVALGRIDAPAASALWGAGGSDETTEQVPGRAVVRMGDAAPVTVQCYWTPDPREARRLGDDQDLRLIEAFRPTVVTHPVLHVRRPRAWNESPSAAWKANLSAELAEGYASGSSGLVDWSRARTAEASAPAAMRGKDADGWSEIVMVSALEPGNLARLDDDTGWVVVEQVDPVENDGTRVRIQWRGSEGAGDLVVSRTRTVRIRHMTDGVY